MKDALQLLSDSLDEPLSAEDQLRLAQWLEADPENVREFVLQAHLHYSLRQVTRANWAFNEAQRSLLTPRVGLAPCMALAATLTLIATLSVWLFGERMGLPAISHLTGSASILRAGQSIPATIRQPLLPGDVLRTTSTSSVAIAFSPEKTVITLRPSTELVLSSLSGGKRFALPAGTLEATVARQRPFRPMLIRTPEAEARVLGTRLSLSNWPGATRLDVAEGKVRFTSLATGAHTDVSAKHYAVAASTVVLAALPETGGIFRESWTNIPGGNDVLLRRSPRFPDHPDVTERLSRFEVVPKGMTNFGDRIRGYLHPPKTGRYAFFISGADEATLWLSPDENPDRKTIIGYSESALPGEWSEKHSQQSLTLTAGKRYYIEVLRKCGSGSDHLAVAWRPPGGEREIISSEFLSAYGVGQPGKSK